MYVYIINELMDDGQKKNITHRVVTKLSITTGLMPM